MWITRDKSACENCGILMGAFYPPNEKEGETYLCPECTFEMNEHKKYLS
jgi:ribosomal protein S27AE